jgi:hypothetical protein
MILISPLLFSIFHKLNYLLNEYQNENIKISIRKDGVILFFWQIGQIVSICLDLSLIDEISTGISYKQTSKYLFDLYEMEDFE